MQEILLKANKRVGGKVVTMRAASGIYTLPALFDEAKGIDINKKRVLAPSVRKYHLQAQEKLNNLTTALGKAESEMKEQTKDAMAFHYVKMSDGTQCNWLESVVDAYQHPEAYIKEEDRDKAKTFFELADDYLKAHQFSYDHTKGIQCLVRSVARYEGFVRATDGKRKDFTFSPHTITRDDVEDFRDYLRSEQDLAEEHPKLFAELFRDYPASVGKGHLYVVGRGENTILKTIKKLKAFQNWLLETNRTTNRPFDGIKIGCEKFGTPYYISLAERDLIASTPMPTKHLEVQRDIFIFQCHIGCRVSDLTKLTEANLQDGVLTYTPHKTKDEGVQALQARVPLTATAKQLIEKYRGADKQGRLFPCIADQNYNEAIKQVFTIAGITRNVAVRNARTGETEMRPINEVASSHLARRTFVGNAYKEVQDPNIIGAMSGHVTGSQAFSRYRNIEIDTLKDVVGKIDTATPLQAEAKNGAATALAAQLLTLTPDKLAAVMAIIR